MKLVKTIDIRNIDSRNDDGNSGWAQCEIDALFTAWTDDRQSKNPQPLRSWISRHPQYAEALIGWAADMPLLEYGLENAVSDQAGEARTLSLGRMALAEMRTQYFTSLEKNSIASSTAIDQTAPLNDMILAAKSRGLTGKALAGQVGIGLPLLAKMNQRLIHLATLPDELINRLANSLQVSVEQVRDYLARPATLSSAAQYKSDGVPQVADAEDFANAVRACPDMTQEQKQFWLNQQVND